MPKIILLSIFSFLFLTVANQSFSQELIGKELSKTDNINSAVESGIGLLFGAKKLQGEIEKVIVTDDSYNSLEINVNYAGFANKWLKGSIINSEQRVLSEIKTKPIQLTEGESEKQVKFDLNTKEENELLESAFLKLLVCEKESSVSGKVFLFLLSKNWTEKGLSSDKPVYDFIQEDLVVQVKPTPVGSAVELKNTNEQSKNLPVPQRSVKNIYTNKVYKSKVVRTNMRTFSQMQMAQPSKSTSMNPPPANNRAGTATKDQMKVANTQLKLLNQPYKLADKPEEKEEEIDTKEKGPGESAITLWDEIKSDIDFDYSEGSISSISTDIFPDINPNSGFYYYYPSSYSLVWDKDESYKFNILYGSADDEGQGKVNILATLSPSVSSKERAMIDELVEDYATRNGLVFKKLKPVPLQEGSSVELAVKVSDEDIYAQITDIFKPVQVSWPMESKKTDDLLVILKEAEINGIIELSPTGEMPAMKIPLKISLDDQSVLGKISLQKNSWRNTTWKNEMPFPVELKYIHALFLNKEGEGIPYIYSWDLGGKEIPVLASAKFDAGSVPTIVDNLAQKIWIEYSVPKCIACMDKVVNELTGGTVSARKQKIEVVSYGILERTGAFVIEVTLRSRYVDPKGSQVIELQPLKVNTDDETFYLEPLFKPEEQKMEYEYKLKMVTDEKIYKSEWIYSDEMSLSITKSFITNAFGEFPGEEE
jgi:predicted DNA-binding antitoxin AbrB/MazE fold protein